MIEIKRADLISQYGIDLPKGDYIIKKEGSNYLIYDTKGDILGCILVGLGHKDVNKDGYLDVVHSKDAMAQLLAACPDGFDLEIVNC